MKLIQTLVDTLNAEEKKTFRDFLTQHRKEKEGKNLNFFNILSQKDCPSREEQVILLYGENSRKNSNALSSLKKRLATILNKFLVTKQFEDDNTYFSQAIVGLSLAKHFFNKGQSSLAWEYLKEAKSFAITNGNTELLGLSQSIMLENAESLPSSELKLLIEEKRQNSDKAKLEMDQLIVWSQLSHEIRSHQQKGQAFPIEILENLSKNPQVEQSLNNSPRILYGITELLRKASFSAKEFDVFEGFILLKYKLQLENGHLDQDENSFYTLSLIYMIAHIKFRKREFDNSLYWISKLEEKLSQNSKRYLARFQAKTLLLKALCINYSGRIIEAQRIFSTIEKLNLEPIFEAGYLLYKGLFLFCEGKYSAANKVFMRFPYSDQWCKRNLGLEFMLKMKLTHLIIQTELKHIDLALNKVDRIQREYKSELRNTFFDDASFCIKYISNYLQDPDFFKNNQGELKTELAGRGGWKNDLQSIAFISWVRSKALNENYYDTLIRDMAL